MVARMIGCRSGAAIRLAGDVTGATAVEYGIIAGTLSLAIAVVVPEIGAAVVHFFEAAVSAF